MVNSIIIVLGQYLKDDGTLSLQCRERCFYAYTLYAKGRGNTFLLSGGTVNTKAGISEAQAMKNYLVSLGVDESAIITEDNSQNTYENAKFCAQILKGMEYEKLILVSSSYHIYRWYFNPVRFFNWLFHLKVIPNCCMDSLITLAGDFDPNRPSVFALVENDKNLQAFMSENPDKNVFLKTVNSPVKKGRRMKKIKAEDLPMLEAHIKNLYRLDELETIKL
ncbi:MAG TPA: YdcF family protein [Clostridia bacterium]|jgi:hypothetical protein|nr:YdcF family protein [Clostridia bacterium]